METLNLNKFIIKFFKIQGTESYQVSDTCELEEVYAIKKTILKNISSQVVSFKNRLNDTTNKNELRRLNNSINFYSSEIEKINLTRWFREINNIQFHLRSNDTIFYLNIAEDRLKLMPDFNKYLKTGLDKRQGLNLVLDKKGF